MTYTVKVTREDGNWLADVLEVAGAHTFARTLEGLTKSVREVIVLMADLPDDAEVVWDWDFSEVDDEVVTSAAHIGRHREDVAKQTAALAGKLVDRGMSVRDAAVLLRITPGRVSQLTGRRKTSV